MILLKWGFQESLNIIANKLEMWFNGAVSMLPNFVIAILSLLIFYFIAKLTQKVISRYLLRSLKNEALSNLFCRVSYLIILTLGLFTSLSILNLDKTVTSLLAGVGVIGLALSFAFQDIAANFVSGTILAFRRPFHNGDIVEIEGEMGTVQETNLRVTTIRTFQGQIVYVPNRLVLQDKIKNYTVGKERRIDLGVGVSYGEDLEKVREVTIEAVAGVKGVDNNKEVGFDYEEFGGSSINFKVRFWITYPDQPGYLEVKSNAIIAIKKAFDQHSITIPFPIRTLDFGIKGGKKLSEMGLSVNQNQEN